MVKLKQSGQVLIYICKYIGMIFIFCFHYCQIGDYMCIYIFIYFFGTIDNRTHAFFKHKMSAISMAISQIIVFWH